MKQLMTNIFLLLFGLVAVHLQPSDALADTPEKISGTWVLDAEATEESALAAPPYKAAEWFGLAAGYMVGIIYQFEKNGATIHTYGNDNRREYQFLSRQDTEIKYIPKNTQGAATDTLTVSIVSDKNIKIFHTGSPEMGYLLWKRVNLDPRRTTPNDVKAGLDAWMTSLQKIMKAFDTHPARTEEWDDEALLHDGRTVEVHRKVAFYPKWPDEYSLKVKHPDTGESIEWRGERHVNPIMLDFVDGIPYLVVKSARVFSNVKLYGCPELPFVFLKYEKNTSQWIPLARNLAPKVLRTANLSARYDGTYMRDGKRQNKDFIARDYRGNKGATNGSFTADIPENYDAWDYFLKGRSYKNVRFENDCRPPLPKPVDSINPKSPVPISQNVALEILETKEYDPVWVIEEDPNAATSNWSKLAWDAERDNACKALFRPAEPNSPQMDGWLSFIKDVTGKKVTAYTGNRLCDANAFWAMDYVAERGRMVIIKASPAGDVIYRISFDRPAEIYGYMGHLMPPTFKTEKGYLYFEWWNTNQSGRNRHIKRAMKVRLREPSIATLNPTLSGTHFQRAP